MEVLRFVTWLLQGFGESPDDVRLIHRGCVSRIFSTHFVYLSIFVIITFTNFSLFPFERNNQSWRITYINLGRATNKIVKDEKFYTIISYINVTTVYTLFLSYWFATWREHELQIYINANETITDNKQDVWMNIPTFITTM